MFEERTQFKDSLFYDISAWSFLHSFNLEFTNYSTKLKTEELKLEKPNGKIINENNYAYLFSWDDYYTPKALYKLFIKPRRLFPREKANTFRNSFSAHRANLRMGITR